MTKPDHKEKSKSNKQRLVALIISVSTVTAGIAAFLQNIEPIQNKINSWFGSGSAKITYTRLNGAYQVPVLMFRSEYFRENTKVIFINYQETFDFWKTGDLKDAKFGIGPLGDELRKALNSFVEEPTALNDPIARITFTPDLILQFKYIDRWMFNLSVEQIKRVEESLGYSYPVDPEMAGKVQDKIKRKIENATLRVGYLFLTITSESSALEDAEIKYKLFRIEPFGEKCIQTMDRINPNGLSPEENHNLKLPPRIEKGEIYLLLLAIYRADDKRYPQEFCSSVIVPYELTWVENGNHKSKVIPQPSLERGGHKEIPFGWWQQ